MTVSTTNISVDRTGDGATVDFSFDFKVQTVSDLAVYVADVLKTYTTHYTAVLNSNGVGGTVTFVSAPANAAAIVITRAVALTQGTALPVQGNIPERTVENMFDKLTLQTQELDARAIQLPPNTATTVSPILPVPEASKSLAWNSGATALENVDAQGSVTSVATSTDASVSNVFTLAGGTITTTGTLILSAAAALGDTIYASATNVLSKLSGNTSATRKYMGQTGNGSVSAAPTWTTIDAGDVATGALAKARQHASTAYIDAGNSYSTAQLPNAANAIDVGSTALPFRNFFIGAANAATKFVSGASGAERTVTFPDANSNTVQPDTGAASNFLTAISSAGVISKAQPDFSDLSGGIDLSTQASGVLPIANGGSNNASLGVLATGIIAGDGSKLTQVTAAAGQSWRVNAGGTAVEAYTAAGSGTVTSFSAGDLSPIFTTSEATVTTTPALTFSLTDAAARSILANDTSGSAAPAYTVMTTTLMSAQARVYGGFGGATSFRALPTSGSISGTYYHIGNWTSTGTLTAAAGTRIYITGAFTLDHAVTVSTGGPTPKTAAAGMIFGASGGGPGAGVSGFSGGSSGAGFGGFGGNGSYDGSHFVNGGGTYSIDDHFGGSCGGQGSAANVADTGGIGGGAGGGFGVFATGAISINADITATGGAGGNGSGASSTGCGGSGGSGGAVDLQSLSTCTIEATRTVSVAGGAAGTSQASAYNSGGGSGGRVRLRGTAATNSGAITLTGGAAGTGGTGTASAGASGASDIVSEVYARHN